MTFKVSLLGNVSLNDYRFTPANRETSFGTSTNAKSFLVYFDGQEKDKFHTYFGALQLNYKFNDKGTDLTLTGSASVRWDMGQNDAKPGFYSSKFVIKNVSGRPLENNWMFFFNQFSRALELPFLFL